MKEQMTSRDRHSSLSASISTLDEYELKISPSDSFNPEKEFHYPLKDILEKRKFPPTVILAQSPL
jgi:hypothetical protein